MRCAVAMPRNKKADEWREHLTESELVNLLDAAKCRTLQDAMTIRTGASKDAIATSDERKVKLERLGIERALIYKTFVLAWLRADELLTQKTYDLRSAMFPSSLPSAILAEVGNAARSSWSTRKL